jgi:hypothetical protein
MYYTVLYVRHICLQYILCPMCLIQHSDIYRNVLHGYLLSSFLVRSTTGKVHIQLLEWFPPQLLCMVSISVINGLFVKHETRPNGRPFCRNFAWFVEKLNMQTSIWIILQNKQESVFCYESKTKSNQIFLWWNKNRRDSISNHFTKKKNQHFVLDHCKTNVRKIRFWRKRKYADTVSYHLTELIGIQICYE